MVRRKGIPVHVSPQVMIELRLISPDGILEIPDEAAEGITTVGDAVKYIEDKQA